MQKKQLYGSLSVTIVMLYIMYNIRQITGSDIIFKILDSHIMRNDPTGLGHYHAPRGNRKHQGIDLLCIAGQEVFAPFDGFIVREVDPYGDNQYNGVLLRDRHGLEMKIMYMLPIENKLQASVKKGEIIGYCQDISLKYSSEMKSHLHIEIWLNGLVINPTSYLL